MFIFSPAAVCLLLALPLCDCSSFPKVLQPVRASFKEGTLAVLSCKIQGKAIQDYNVLWFQTKPGVPPANILRHEKDGSVVRLQGFKNRFQAIRVPGNSSHLLQIQHVQTDDSAIYWCMVESGNFSDASCGAGTRVSIFGGRTVRKPSIIILTSEQDTYMSTVYVLCAVSNFYPGVLEVTWNIGGNKTTSEITGVPFMDGPASYSLSSLLEVPGHIWRKSPTIFCEVRHDSSHTVISKSLQECTGI